MAARLRVPTLALAALSIGLNVAILGCAGRTLNVFMQERYTSTWFMPVWSSHFDTRELWALIGTSAAVLVLNFILMAGLFAGSLPANLLILTSSGLSSAVSLIAIIFSSVLNNQDPNSDTLQTWTCRWRDVADEGVPRNYDTLCHETRFAYYTTIPSLILQLLLLGLALYAFFVAGRKARGLRLEGEKDHELGDVRQLSVETKMESPKSGTDSLGIVAGGGRGKFS